MVVTAQGGVGVAMVSRRPGMLLTTYDAQDSLAAKKYPAQMVSRLSNPRPGIRP